MFSELFNLRNVIAAMAATITSISAPAAPIEFIENGDFEAPLSLAFWDESGAGNTRAPGNAINDGGATSGDDHNVFDTGSNPFFGSGRFAVLGDNGGRIFGAGTNGPASGTHVLSQDFLLPFELGGSPVDSWDLDISFGAAFDGNGFGDVFFAAVIGPNTTPLFIPRIFAGNQFDFLNSSVLSLTQLLPGAYTLYFSLIEGGGPGTTAVGIDNVSAVGEANFAAVPLPASVWLLGGALAGLGIIRRHRR